MIRAELRYRLAWRKLTKWNKRNKRRNQRSWDNLARFGL